jgi:hypothetical protein
MLNDKLKTEVSRDRLLYWIGRHLGLFPENSFDQYKYLFTTENEIHSILATIYRNLQHCGVLITTKDDKIKWNDAFAIDTYVKDLQKKKDAKTRETQVRTKVKSEMRKFVTKGETITSFGLSAEVTDINLDLFEIKTKILKVDEEWAKAFTPGVEVIWKYIRDFDDQYVFGAKAELEGGDNSQNLLCLESGKVTFDRDF